MANEKVEQQQGQGDGEVAADVTVETGVIVEPVPTVQATLAPTGRLGGFAGPSGPVKPPVVEE